MTHKGWIYVILIVSSFIILTILIAIIPDSFDITGTGNHTRALAPFSLIFGLVTPIIFVTQFPTNQIYKYFGWFLLAQLGVGFIVSITNETSFSYGLIIIAYILSLTAYLGFFIYLWRYENRSSLSILLILYLIQILYTNGYSLNFLLSLDLARTGIFVLVMVIPAVLGLMILVFECIVVFHAAKLELIDS